MQDSRDPPMIEPMPVLDIFGCGLGSIEIVGPCARFVVYVEQDVPGADFNPQRVVVAKIVLPLDAVPAAISMTTAKLANHWLSETIPRMFKLAS